MMEGCLQSWSDRDMAKDHNHPAALFVGILTGLSYGLIQTISGPVLEESPWNQLSSGVKGLVNSMTLVGAAIGSFTGGFFSDRFGPKKVIIFSAFFCIACLAGLGIQKHYVLLIVLRFFSGLPVGFLSVLGPLYVSEQSSSKRRGFFVTLYQTAVCGGCLLAYLLNLAFFSLKDGWRFEFGLSSIVPIVLLCGSFCYPESIGFLNSRRPKDESAIPATPPINTHTESDSLLANQENQIENDPNVQLAPRRTCAKLTDFMKAVVYSKRAFFTAVVLACAQQLTGINAIMFYMPSIFESAGVKVQTMKILASCGANLLNMLSTVVAMFCVDRLGRKPLLVSGLSIMSFGHFLVVLSGIIPGLANKEWILSLPGVFIFIFGFEVGPGPVYFVVVSELFPEKVRGRAMSMMGLLNWLCNVLIVQLYPMLVEWIGERWVFTALCVISMAAALAALILLKETKGKSLDEITAAKQTRETE
ncbi:Sugar Porter (MFS) [Blattamonas nauphoetae]|uniref:Sugar Porter (MFS) n=1 Tax=Blattamonas nauphoetae TaxID=2049346 RepID=A0ABQ9YG66_9EUKA|nr:Sugar Porter (MFS) [Blattamonas nauphoetae]